MASPYVPSICAAVATALTVALSPSLAAAALVLAAGLTVWVPARAARGEDQDRARAGCALGEALLALLAAGVAGLLAGAAPAALGAVLLYLAAYAALLAGVAAWPGGQALATTLGALLLGAPYLAGIALPGASPGVLLELVLRAPLAVLCGTCAGVDVLRMGSLYQVFPAAQQLPYAYPGLGAALAPLLLAALAAWAPRAWRAVSARALAGGARVALPLLALGLVLGGAAPARAQGLLPAPSGADPSATGDLQTRVRLGYYLPRLEGSLRVDPAYPPDHGDNLSFARHLDLNQAFTIPTFEIELAWPNAGGFRLQYLENEWKGETQTTQSLLFEEERIQPLQNLDVYYRYRTIALGGSLDLPVASFLTIKLMTTTRYVKHEFKVRAFPQALSERNSLEAILPTVGAGVDVFIWNVISAYGDIQWLDFRTSLFGNEDKRFTLRYREWRAGVRLELVEHAHVMVEWYSLFTDVRDGSVERYKTELNGLRVMVAVLF
ncbi:MAG: hypothetical protein AB7N76_06555 [Planctomycetota bacterium]